MLAPRYRITTSFFVRFHLPHQSAK